MLAASIREIHTKNASHLSFEELYRNAYQLVLIKKGLDLYDHVVELERNWLQNEVLAKVTAVIAPSLALAGDTVDTLDQTNERKLAGERFLLRLKEVWEDHQLCMGMITDVLMYLVRFSKSQRSHSFQSRKVTSFLYVLISPKE